MNVIRPYLDYVDRTVPARMVVIGAYQEIPPEVYVDHLRKAGESWHFLVPKRGEIVRCLPLTSTGFYCGRSDGPDGQHVNDYSFGVCVEGFDGDGAAHRMPLSQRQALYELISYLRYYDGGCPWIGMAWDVTRGMGPKSFPLNLTVLQRDLGYTIWRKGR